MIELFCLETRESTSERQLKLCVGVRGKSLNPDSYQTLGKFKLGFLINIQNCLYFQTAFYKHTIWRLKYCLMFQILFFFFKILLIFREGKGGRKRERETLVCGRNVVSLPLAHTLTGDQLKPRRVP